MSDDPREILRDAGVECAVNGEISDFWPDGIPRRATTHVLDNYPYQVWGWAQSKRIALLESEVEKLKWQRDEAVRVTEFSLGEWPDMAADLDRRWDER